MTTIDMTNNQAQTIKTLDNLNNDDWLGICKILISNQDPRVREWVYSEYPTQEKLLEYVKNYFKNNPVKLNDYYNIYIKHSLETLVEKTEVQKTFDKNSDLKTDYQFKEYLKSHQIKLENVENLAYMCKLSRTFITYRKDNAMQNQLIVCTVLNRGPLFQPISNVERSRLTKRHNTELLDAHRKYPTIYQRGNEEFRVYGPYLDMNDAIVFKFLLSMCVGKVGYKISTTYQDIAQLIQPKLRIHLKKDQICKMRRSLTRLSQAILEVITKVSEKKKVSFSGTLISCKVTDNKDYDTVFDVTINPYLLEHMQNGFFSHIDKELLTNMTDWESKLALTLLVDKWKNQQYTMNQIKEIFGKSEFSDKHIKDYMRKTIKDLIEKKFLEKSSCYNDGNFYLVKL